MTRLTILTAPDSRLKRKALPVPAVTDAVRRLMENMAETMYYAQGIGLAATQVGVTQRVIVVDVEYAKKDGKRSPIFLANPEIIRQDGEIVWNEGCLSVPEHTSDVTRSAQIQVKGLNQHGQEVIIDADDVLAVCFQHEIDHLDGILFIDHISRLKRSIILQKLKKKKQNEE
ncbi:MAG: peptide deformylase [Magnetococcales bacterium]|nr:peptide deformylase [Magnetococcales bacterium]MBF0272075.1 peptide deformylase [Magnetococcales bacterium]